MFFLIALNYSKDVRDSFVSFEFFFCSTMVKALQHPQSC
jgi:hypothetical protein